MGLEHCAAETFWVFHDRWTKLQEQVVADAQILTLTDFPQILLNKMRMHSTNQRLGFRELMDT